MGLQKKKEEINKNKKEKTHTEKNVVTKNKAIEKQNKRKIEMKVQTKKDKDCKLYDYHSLIRKSIDNLFHSITVL